MRGPPDQGQVLWKWKEELLSPAVFLHLAGCPDSSVLPQNTDAQLHPRSTESQSPGQGPASLFQQHPGDSDISGDGKEEESTIQSEGVDTWAGRAGGKGGDDKPDAEMSPGTF